MPFPRRPFTPISKPGTLHLYTSRLVAFEHAPPGSSPSTTSSTEPVNTLLWIGGLGGGLLPVPYTHTLADSLPPTWRLVEPLLSSGYEQWGTQTLGTDARDLRACVAYFRREQPDRRIVLMGHSTGAQDCMEYILGPQNGDAAT